MHPPPAVAAAPGAHVLAAGRTFLQTELVQCWQAPEVQEALAAAKSRFGHALCACRATPHKLQIRCRQGRFHLAVWPHEGPAHDTRCAFFRDALSEPPGESPLARPGRPRLPGEGGLVARTAYAVDARSDALAGQRLTMQGFALRLWELASLCEWHPAWTRDWGRTRYQLLQAASVLLVDGVPGEEALFIPRPYREAAQQALNGEWQRYVQSLGQAKHGRWLIAPVRAIVAPTADQPGALYLRHLREPLRLSTPCRDFLDRACGGAMANIRQRNGPDAPAGPQWTPEAMGIFQVVALRGRVWVRSAWLMLVHPRLHMPAASPEAVCLVDRLMADGHAFQHLPSEAPASRRLTPDWLVRHVLDPTGQPVARAALEILDRGCSPEFAHARDLLAQRLQDAGVPTWTWMPSGPRQGRVLPPLPPSDQRPGGAVHAELRQIHAALDADYRFGPATKFSQA